MSNYPEPEKGEPWSGITAEELEINGFEKDHDTFALDGIVCYYHPRCQEIRIVPTITGTWVVYYVKPILRLRDVKYMYQIDNMFHGFTDRWLGLI